MKTMSGFAVSKLAVCIALAFPAMPSFALEEHTVYNPAGEDVFQIRFFDQDDGYFLADGNWRYASTWNMDSEQKRKILAAMSYWAEIIQPAAGQRPAIVNVGTFDQENAAGWSENVSDNSAFSLTKLQAALQGKPTGELNSGSHAMFIMGQLDFDTLAYVPSQLPRSGQFDSFGTAFHELAHGLGIANPVENRAGENTPYYGKTLGSWAEHLRDDNGNPARPGQAVLCDGCKNQYDPGGFDVRKDQAYFTGQHVDEVLAGAMRGVPVKILAEDDSIDDNYMSHSELKNSLMSHQEYRNYTTFMEAELAALQDMGYTIDRRNFYGYSVYGNGQTIVNNHGFFRRNASGTAYLPGQYNSATLGLGLHIYGSGNTLVQQADLLTNGAGGAGVRIDGVGNTLVVAPGTRIHADGLNGRGLMVAYGKDHSLVQRGDVQATGQGGIAASFDFGNNALGNDTEYRGSYIQSFYGWPLPLLDELNGALVDRFDVSGRLAGKAAAIYMSDNALVRRINILQGAQLQGDIISRYDQRDAQGQQRLTLLSFGQAADAQGRATGQADAHFGFNYQGNIQGVNNLALAAQGGYTALNGVHRIYSMEVSPGATLAGSSSYALNAEGAFINNGTLSPGNALADWTGRMDIAGNYRQGATGKLLMAVDGNGGHATLNIAGNAELDGQLTLAPRRDWYANSWTMRSDTLLQATGAHGAFTAVNSQLASPTLTFDATPLGDNTYRFSVLRRADAYSRYAQDENARQLGTALDGLVASAGPDLQTLYRTLDFSVPNGSSVGNALAQLSPASYSALFASALNREHQISDLVSGRGFAPQLATNEWRSFAIPFGGGFSQSSLGSRVGYAGSGAGVVFGAEKQSSKYRDWVLGFHGAASGQSVSIKGPDNARGETMALDVGVHARYAADPMAGTYLFGHARIGVEDGKMERRISVEDYTSTQRADWTGLNGTVMAGGGYRWAFSETLSAGPMAALNYTRLSRPDVTESGLAASRLKLSANHLNSLRSSIGVNASLNLPSKAGSALKADLQLSWDRELLQGGLTQLASFVGYESAGFSSKNKLGGRDSLGLRAGLTYDLNKDAAVGAQVSSDLLRPGYDAVTGNLSATWRF